MIDGGGNGGGKQRRRCMYKKASNGRDGTATEERPRETGGDQEKIVIRTKEVGRWKLLGLGWKLGRGKSKRAG